MTRVLVDQQGGLLTITLNRPEARNALENSMIARLVELFTNAQHDESIRAVLLRGAGKAFCSGDDLKDMGTDSHPVRDNPFDEYAAGYPRIVHAMRALNKPIVVAVHGYAMGAGMELMLAGDYIVAATGAKVSLPFVKRGIAAGTALLIKETSYHYAADLLFTGRVADIDELHRQGIVARMCDPGEVGDVAQDVAEKLATAPTSVVAAIKRALREGEHTGMDAALALQVGATVESSLSEDFAEGKEAFAEKREPKFSGK